MKIESYKVGLFSIIIGVCVFAIAAALFACSVEQQPTKTQDEIEAEQQQEIERQTDAAIENTIASMSLIEKVSQMVVARPEAISGAKTSFSGDASDKMSEYPLGGVCFFLDNISDSEGTKTFVEDLQGIASNAGSGVPMFISTDEEGGGWEMPDSTEKDAGYVGVSRLAIKELEGTQKFYPMSYYKYEGPGMAYGNAKTIGRYLSEYGFNWNFAPVADINSNPDNPVIGYRAYSDDVTDARFLVSAAVEGYESVNMACALKHFPGQGDVSSDTHVSSATIQDKDLYQMQSQEIRPFEAGIESGADAVMMGHVIVSSVDDIPASLSSQWVDVILRQMMGFDGVIVTDSLEMSAVKKGRTNSEVAIMAVKAGNDVLLLPEKPFDAIDAIVSAVQDGEIDESAIDEHVARILKMKAKHGIWNALGEE